MPGDPTHGLLGGRQKDLTGLGIEDLRIDRSIIFTTWTHLDEEETFGIFFPEKKNTI